LNAAVWWLNQWVVNGSAPPIPALLQVSTTPGEAVVFVTDTHGNVLGGVRSPQVDAPVATLSGVGNSGGLGGFCFIFGRTIPFSSSQLAGLYKNHGQFVSRWGHATQNDVKAGYLLPADAVELEASSSTSQIGK
jgi:hypothetical protein